MRFTHSVPPSAEDALGLVRQTAARRHADMDVTIRTDLRHHSGQRPAFPSLCAPTGTLTPPIRHAPTCSAAIATR
jgi:hypothetical protein